ncbi:cupin domain-containing protein [Desulfobacter sp.]|uniref:cupin domain-containing protein n=1 Tax=Desulfobacter sp. TaxID=2294 RepID=UPI000E8CC774|nr:cupin domain-containing protein [Desulfobacter sp.]MBP8828648.1 cupin domain-containing protein [Desulfobacter sp.]HBT87811.1 cupin [Desulfobacter sp.]
MENLFENVPDNLPTEQFTDLLKGENIRIERIVSLGHTSPESGWYSQNENEWVLVLKGSGTILFENEGERVLNKGDYLNIPAHTKHKVTRTDPDSITIWLAVFY